jgi:aminoglycoside phosphotransferase family enzyme
MSDRVAPGLAAKVAFLRRPDSYPDAGAGVQAIETHMSWLFLTERQAYKLKKPFRRNGIDYGTAAKRRLNCQRELRLNRRLAPDAYLGVVPLTIDGRGQLALDGPGRRIDWLVRMRRLPGEATLERGLQAGRIGPGDAEAVIALLAPFFAEAPTIAMAPARYLDRLARIIRLAAAELLRPEFGLPPALVADLAVAIEQVGAGHAGLLAARAPRLVEGHGDLRPEHIYLTTPPVIIDCIEFDRDLRLHDPVDELAFLAMECDRCGRPELHDWLFAAYTRQSEDQPAPALIDYYKAHNAFRRACIAIWHLDDPDTGPRQQWLACAQDYLARARHCLHRAGQGS